MAKQDRFTKQEAMDYLGLKAAKSIERYVKSGKLSVAESVRPAGGGKPAPMFSRTELDRFKAANPLPGEATGETEATEGATEETALLVPYKATGATGEATAFLDLLTEWERRRAPIGELSHKLTLSMDEAARLSGIPVAKLREAARGPRPLLRAEKIGRGLRVRRQDLEAYVAKLFK